MKKNMEFDYVKHMAEGAAGSVTVGAFFNFIHEITALASLVSVEIRIYETETVRGLLGR